MKFSTTSLWSVVAVVLAGCAAPVPQKGETVYLDIGPQVTIDRMSSGITINLRNALAQGASREDVANGRLAFASCYEKTDAGLVERGWLVRVPANLGFLGYPIATEYGEIRPGTPKEKNGPLGEALKKTPPPTENEFLVRQYSTSQDKVVACQATSTPGAVRVKMGSFSNKWWLHELDFEEGWIQTFPKEALEQGRVFIASCALGTDAFAKWYVEAQPGQSLKKDQVVKVRAGNSVGAGPGPLSQVVDASPSGYKSDMVFGSMLVRCSQ